MAAHGVAHKLSQKPRLRGVSTSGRSSSRSGPAPLSSSPPTRPRPHSRCPSTPSRCRRCRTSALYHRVTWTPERRRWMRRLDHTMIFVFIAGSYTPVVLVMHGTLADLVLIVVWASAAGGMILNLVWKRAEVVQLRRLHRDRMGRDRDAAPALGGDRPGRRRPARAQRGALHGGRRHLCTPAGPPPEVFGYHEIFHVFVIAAAAVQYAAVAIYALPAGLSNDHAICETVRGKATARRKEDGVVAELSEGEAAAEGDVGHGGLPLDRGADRHRGGDRGRRSRGRRAGRCRPRRRLRDGKRDDPRREDRRQGDRARPHPGATREGREAAADAGVDIDWIEGDAEQLSFDDASFGAVISVFGCMFAPDHHKAAEEIARVLCRAGAWRSAPGRRRARSESSSG